MTETTAIIQNKTGLHARPASVFVQMVSSFKSDIHLTSKGKTVDAKSILGIMSLGLVKGTEVTIRAEGEDEQEAIAKLQELIQNNFNEE